MTSIDETQLVRLLDILLARLDEYALIITNNRGEITWLSSGAEKILGAHLDNGHKLMLEEFFTAEDRAKKLPELEMQTALARGISLDDRWHVRKDGSRFWAAGAMVALRDENNALNGFGKVLRNRTDVKEQLVELRNRVDALTTSDNRMRTSLQTVAHELRNPLAPLAAAVELLSAKSNHEGSEWLQKPLATIQRQLVTMKRLVNDLVDANRLGAGKLTIEKSTVQLDAVLRHSVETIQDEAAAKTLNLNLMLPNSCITVDGDPVRLQQVFTNILQNSVKFTPEGGNIWVIGTLEGAEAVVQIEDSGIGIAPDKQAQVFDLFTQVEPTQARGGLGIGLALVRDLVTLHEGSVQIRSDGLGKGTLVIVRLPATPDMQSRGGGT